jgi:arylsulfatase A-like enzyme/cytochrome c-type biogenesis protein CcmH/NrfG
MRRPVLITALAVAAALVCVVVARRSGFGPRPPRPNLLLVSLDTLRADRLGAYGYAQAQTPRLDALAARGVRFTQATTVAPLTLPAHASLLTGTFPAFHGVRDNGGFYLGDDALTLAEVLKAQGYATAGFVGAFVLDSRWGIAQGFDTYFDDFDLSKYGGVGLDTVQRRGDEVVAHAAAWLDAARAAPFFAWVHLYDPHAPYDAPEPYRSRFPPGLQGAYDAEVAYTDAVVGTLLERVGQERLKDTLVVVVGDHGESLGEHQEQAHGFFVYDATVQVPLIVAGPGLAPRTVDEQVRLVDVMPTVLERLGVPASAAVQGRSLVPLTRGERLGLTAWSETYYPRYHYGWSQLEALRDGRFKLVAAPRPELYDLRADPHETRDLSAAEPERVAAFTRVLDELRTRLAGRAAAAGPQAVDRETEERLQALGYVGGSVSARHLEERPRGDPKDKIGLYNLLKRAGSASLEGRLDAAVALVREALAADPEIIEGHTLLGNFHAKAGRHADAVDAYRRALALDPEHRGATFSLALAYKNLGRLDDAQAGFERVRRLDPKNGKALWQLADLDAQRGRLEDAQARLEEALALDVDRPGFLLKLGEVHIEQKRWSEARAALTAALEAKPDLPHARFDLALVAEAQGDAATAVRGYEAELARDPKSHRAAFNLAKLLLRAGRASEAAARFRAAVEAQPDFGTGWLYLAKALCDSGDLQAAEQAARTGLARRPEAGTAPLGHYVLADVYTRLGRERDARRELAAARKAQGG